MSSCVSKSVDNRISNVPLPPKELKVSKISDKEDTYQLIWSLSGVKTTLIDEYIAEVSLDRDFKEVLKKVSTKSNTAVFIGLKGFGTLYYFRVRARGYMPEQLSNFSDVKELKIGVASKAQRPNSPSNIQIEVYSHRILIIWDEVINLGKLRDGYTDAEIANYQIEVSKSDKFKGSVEAKQTMSIFYDLKGLEPETEYYIRLYAINNSDDKEKNISNSSEVFKIKTNGEGEEPPTIPLDLSLVDKSITETSFSIKWNAPSYLGIKYSGKPSELIYYRIEYSQFPDFSMDNGKSILVKSNIQEYVLSNLIPFTKYYVRVSAINDNKEGFNRSIYSIPLKGGVKTLFPSNAKFAKPPDPPTSVNISLEVSSKQARINWHIPIYSGKLINGDQAKVVRYQIQYSENKNFASSNNLFSKSPTILITGLKHETKYYVRVKSINNNGVKGLDTSEYVFLENGFTTTR